MCGNMLEHKFISCFYGLLDVQSRTLAYANAGHNAPLLVRRDGRCLRLKEGGAVFGVFAQTDYEEREIELQSGDRLLLFTDGLTEARNAADEEFGEERLVTLMTTKRRLGAAELQRQVMAAVTEFSGGEFHDDATLMVIAVE